MTARMEIATIVRFGLMAASGLAIDLGIAFALAELAGVSIAIAMAAGFVAGAGFNYLASEYWVFSDGERRASPQRGLLFLVVLGCVISTRLLCAALLTRILGDAAIASLVILISVGLSFCVNYVLSRLLFSPQSKHPSSNKETTS